MDYDLDSSINIYYRTEDNWLNSKPSRIVTDMKHLYINLAKLESKGAVEFYIEKEGVTFEKWLRLI
jgi:hypothetical protein